MTTKSKAIRRDYDIESVVNAAAERVAAKKLVTGNRSESSSGFTVDLGGKTINVSDLLAKDNSLNSSDKHIKNDELKDLDSIIDENNGLLKRIWNRIGKNKDKDDTAALYKRAYLRSKKRKVE
ncbi:hypothetical protein [Pantoea ananatis]|uniref:hypothetical protein n=1 Tax=Pantoea ananas TaxID=553 RepID=UPI003CF5FDB5